MLGLGDTVIHRPVGWRRIVQRNGMQCGFEAIWPEWDFGLGFLCIHRLSARLLNLGQALEEPHPFKFDLL